MKESKKKNSIIFILLGCIVFTFVALVSVAYLAGKDVSNKDTSAAVEEGDDEPEDHYSQATESMSLQLGNISIDTQKYALGGDSVGFFMVYTPPSNSSGPLPAWNVEICGETFQKESSAYFNETVIMPRGECMLEVMIYKGTSKEEGFTTSYNPIPRAATRAMRVFSFEKNVPLNGQVFIEKDLSTELANLNIEGVNWSLQAGERCIAYPDLNAYRIDYKKLKFKVRGLETGLCNITITAKAYSCYDCEVADRKAYKYRRTIRLRVIESVDLTTTPSHTIDQTPTPSIHRSPTPTIYRTPTPSIHRSPTPTIYRTPTPTANN